MFEQLEQIRNGVGADGAQRQFSLLLFRLAYARVQAALITSWETRCWTAVRDIAEGADP